MQGFGIHRKLSQLRVLEALDNGKSALVSEHKHTLESVCPLSELHVLAVVQALTSREIVQT